MNTQSQSAGWTIGNLHSYGDEASWWAGVGINSPIALELWRRSRLTFSLSATWSEPLSDANPPPAAKVERVRLDDDAKDRVDTAEHPDNPPLNMLRSRRKIRLD